MQDAIAILYKVENLENRSQKLREAVDKVLDSKKQLQENVKFNESSKRKQVDNDRKQGGNSNDDTSSVNLELFGKEEEITQESKDNTIEEQDNIIEGKAYIQKSLASFKASRSKTNKRIKLSHLESNMLRAQYYQK